MPEAPVDPTQVSSEAKNTRRRALGRRMIKQGSDIKISLESIANSPDLPFLGQKEKAALDKALKNGASVAEYLDKLGTRLDEVKK